MMIYVPVVKNVYGKLYFILGKLWRARIYFWLFILQDLNIYYIVLLYSISYFS